MAGRSGKETSDDHEYLSSRVCVARGAGAPGALVADPPEPTSPDEWPRVSAAVSFERRKVELVVYRRHRASNLREKFNVIHNNVWMHVSLRDRVSLVGWW